MDRSLHLIFILNLLLLSGSEAASFRFVNRCRHTVWPGLLSGANSPLPPTTGFSLPPSDSRTIQIPSSWSGRLWGRTLCSTDSTGKFACLTGDCASGLIHCNGAGAIPPATLAEFTLNGTNGLDFYDVSLVDGYNLPILVLPMGGSGAGGGDCSPTGCLVDLNGACPAEMSVAGGGNSTSRRVGAIACKSACEAFGDPQYCCSEAYSTPDVCKPSVYSQLFKRACPRAYSYAYDDKTSTFTCALADYTIVFCPPPYTSEKLLGTRRKEGELPLVNKSMMYLHSNGRSSQPSLGYQSIISCAIALFLIRKLAS